MAVKKAPASKTKASATKTAVAPASKATVKKVSKPAPSTTKTKAKVLNAQVPVKENVDPVKSVLSIKAHNDEIKQAKASKKVAKASARIAPAASNTKSVAERSKSKIVKDTAQKTAAKKFAENKTHTEKSAKPCCCCSSKNGLFGAWARAYKNIFNFKGRTSRYEYWAYMLFNLFFAFFVGAGLNIANVRVIEQTGQPCIWCENAYIVICWIWAVVALALTVRRLHDCGYSAWKGFFRPMIAWCIVLFLLSITSTYVQIETTEINAPLSPISTCIGALAIIAFVGVIYYMVKTCIVSGFYGEEKADNVYGAPCFNDDCYKKYGIRYAALSISVIILISLMYIVYMASIAIEILGGNSLYH